MKKLIFFIIIIALFLVTSSVIAQDINNNFISNFGLSLLPINISSNIIINDITEFEVISALGLGLGNDHIYLTSFNQQDEYIVGMAIALNVFIGFGIGSFVQGDIIGGKKILRREIGAIICLSLGYFCLYIGGIGSGAVALPFYIGGLVFCIGYIYGSISYPLNYKSESP